MAADQHDEPGELPVDPLLGQPRMVDDPRISIAQAAGVLGKKPAQVHRYIALGYPGTALPHNGRPLLLSEVETLRDKGEPIPLKHAAHRLGRSLKATLELVADGHLPLVPGTKSMIYPADLAAIMAAKPQPPIRRPARPSWLPRHQTDRRTPGAHRHLRDPAGRGGETAGRLPGPAVVVRPRPDRDDPPRAERLWTGLTRCVAGLPFPFPAQRRTRSADELRCRRGRSGRACAR